MQKGRYSILAAFLLLAGVASLVKVSAWTCESQRNVTVTKCMVKDLTRLIRNKIFNFVRTDPDGKQFYALVPGFVRLAFHSCAAKWCSSRIDLSELGNNGIQDAVLAAEELYVAVQSNPTYTGFSKADLHALCGVVALEVATNNKTRVQFRYGRPDFCPNDDPIVLNQTLPLATMGTEATYEFMKAVFNFTQQETVAIMGAHALGVLRNFLSPPTPISRWVNSSADTLTNEFYKSLLDPRWRQLDLPVAGFPFPAMVWAIDELPTRVLLNTDICLVRHITTDAIGVSQCTTYSSCPLAPTAATVYRYAQHKDVFFKDFKKVFEKMIENGLRDQLLDIVADCTGQGTNFETESGSSSEN